jgi:hypothetical protein
MSGTTEEIIKVCEALPSENKRNWLILPVSSWRVRTTRRGNDTMLFHAQELAWTLFCLNLPRRVMLRLIQPVCDLKNPAEVKASNWLF